MSNQPSKKLEIEMPHQNHHLKQTRSKNDGSACDKSVTFAGAQNKIGRTE